MSDAGTTPAPKQTPVTVTIKVTRQHEGEFKVGDLQKLCADAIKTCDQFKAQGTVEGCIVVGKQMYKF